MEENKDQQISDLLSKIEALDAQQRNIQFQLMQLKLVASKLQQQQPVSAASANVVPARSVKSSFSLEQFIGLKLLNLIGIIVLLIGVVIGVKFAIDKNLISPFVRILLAYIADGLLFGLSVYLREK